MDGTHGRAEDASARTVHREVRTVEIIKHHSASSDLPSLRRATQGPRKVSRITANKRTRVRVSGISGSRIQDSPSRKRARVKTRVRSRRVLRVVTHNTPCDEATPQAPKLEAAGTKEKHTIVPTCAAKICVPMAVARRDGSVVLGEGRALAALRTSSPWPSGARR